jgi:hypothetical protein
MQPLALTALGRSIIRLQTEGLLRWIDKATSLPIARPLVLMVKHPLPHAVAGAAASSLGSGRSASAEPVVQYVTVLGLPMGQQRDGTAAGDATDFLERFQNAGSELVT